MAFPKIIKAGGGERGQYILRDFNDNTVRFVLHYPGKLDPERTRQAVLEVVEQVEVLHGTFFTEGIGAHWKINEDLDESWYFLYVDAAGDPRPTARSIALMPVSSQDKAQIHCTLVQGAESCCLVARMSHLVVDGGDGKYLLGKIVEAYNALTQTGTTQGLQIKNGSRAPEKVYDTVTPEELKKLKKSSPSSTDVRSIYPYPTQEPGRKRMVLASISRETMDLARKKAKTLGASVNDLMMAAAYHAYGQLQGVDPAQPMSINSTMDLRRHCRDGESEGLCNMSGSFLTVLEHGISQDFAQTLSLVAEQTGKIKADPLAGLEGMPLVHSLARNLPIGLLVELMGKIYGSAPVGITNLGNLRSVDFALDGVCPVDGLFAGPLKKKPGMQISVISLDGVCRLAVAVQGTDEDVVLLQSTLDAMVEQIARFATQDE